jgi:hypothetical protein
MGERGVGEMNREEMNERERRHTGEAKGGLKVKTSEVSNRRAESSG